jgi:uncharacterized protein
MKRLEIDDPGKLKGRLLAEGEKFAFRCHPAISCYNQCCRNLNLFLYPYDIIRLKKNLGMTAAQFIEQHTDMVLRPGHHFPDVLLHMTDNAEKTCPFLTHGGCRVYVDRPYTCRMFPIEQGLYFQHGSLASGDRGSDKNIHGQPVYFFRPPDFCMGQNETTLWTRQTWEADQQAAFYSRMTAQWADLMTLFASDPWAGQGPGGPNGKMAMMAAYNMEGFRDFVLNSSFLKRHVVKSDLRRKLKIDDMALLRLGMAWIRLFLFGQETDLLRVSLKRS